MGSNSNFHTRAFLAPSLSKTITHLRIHTYTNQLNLGNEATGDPPTNHWALTLVCSDATAVTLDMAPLYGSNGLRGKLIFTSSDYQAGEAKADEITKDVVFGIKGEITVEKVVQAIMERGREKYTFTEEGVGCRSWVWTVVKDLEELGMLDEGSGKVALEAVSQY